MRPVQQFALALIALLGFDSASLANSIDGGRQKTFDNSRVFDQVVATASASEGNAGDKVLDFVVKTSETSNSPISFDVFTDNGSAAAGSDYQARRQARARPKASVGRN